MVSLEFLDSPDYRRFVRLVFALSAACPENFDICGILRTRYLNNYVIGEVLRIKYRPDLDRVLNPEVFLIL